MSESTVFFIRRVSPEDVLRIYKALNVSLPGPVAVKVHSGEPGNQNFLRPDFWAPMIDALHGTVVECNTAYEGGRNRSAAHWETMRMHGVFPWICWMRRAKRSWKFRTACRSNRTTLEVTLTGTRPCWYCPTSRDILWEDLAVP